MIPEYAMLDIWVSLGYDPDLFDDYLEMYGEALTWANLCGQVRESWHD